MAKVYSKQNIILWSLFFLNPIISLVYFIFFKNKKYKNYIYVSLIMSLIACATIPMKDYDLIRYYENYDKLSSKINFIVYIKEKMDYFFPIVLFILKKNGLKKELVPFISNFITYFCYLKLFKDIFKEEVKVNYIYFILFLAIDFRGATFGIRNTPAIAVAVYASYILFLKKEKKGIIYFFIANIIHIMTLPYTLIALIVYFINEKKILIISKILFIGSLSGYLININILKNIFQGLPLSIKYKNHINFYIDGYWAFNYLKNLNFKSKIFEFLNSLKQIILYSYIVLFIYKKNEHKKYFSFILLVTIIPNMWALFPNLRGRYLVFPIQLTLIVILLQYKSKYVKNKYIYLLSLIIILVFFVNIYEIRLSLLNSLDNYLNLIYFFLTGTIDYKKN